MNRILLIICVNLSSYVSFAQCPTTPITLSNQSEVDAFTATYPGCTQLLNDLIINGGNITNLNGLIQLESSSSNSDIKISNTDLPNLTGLDNLLIVGRNLELDMNDLLTTFEGLEQLELIQTDFLLNTNVALSSFFGLSNLQSIGGALRIRNLVSLQSFDGFDSLSAIGIGDANTSGARGLDIEANISLPSLSGLENLTEINGAVFISNNANLQDLNGLENITEIANSLIIDNNDFLTSIQALSNLETLGFALRIQQNDILPDLQGLEGLQEFSSSLSLTFNNNLSSIEALSNVVSIDDISFIAIKNNPLLSFCAIEFVCDGISSTNTTVEFATNAEGCNTLVEVESDCLLTISENDLSSEIVFYPNPVSEILQIRVVKGVVLEKATVYSMLGEELFSTSEEKVDFTQLSSGIYFISVATNSGTITKKIVKE